MTRREILDRLEGTIAELPAGWRDGDCRRAARFLSSEVRRLAAELAAEGAAARLAADDCLGARNWAAARLAEMIDLGPPPGFPFRPATAADLACLALGG
jgi:hypothetical protein